MYNENLRPRSWDRQRRANLYLRRTHSHRLIPLFYEGKWYGYPSNITASYGPRRSCPRKEKQDYQCEEVLLLWTGCVPLPRGVRLSVKEKKKARIQERARGFVLFLFISLSAAQKGNFWTKIKERERVVCFVGRMCWDGCPSSGLRMVHGSGSNLFEQDAACFQCYSKTTSTNCRFSIS